MEDGDLRATVQELLVEVAVLKSRLEASKESLALQASEYARRLTDLNHAHERAERVLGTYVTQEKFNRELAHLEPWRRSIEEQVSQLPSVKRLAEDTVVWKTEVDSFMNVNRGRNTGYASVFAILIAVASLLGVVWNTLHP